MQRAIPSAFASTDPNGIFTAPFFPSSAPPPPHPLLRSLWKRRRRRSWVASSQSSSELFERVVELQLAKHDAVLGEEFMRAQELKTEIERLVSSSEGHVDLRAAEIEAFERKKRMAIEDEDYVLAEEMKQRINALKNKPSMRIVSPASARASQNATRAVEPPRAKKATFDDHPWPTLIRIISSYKKVPEEQLQVDLEHMRMLLYDVDLPDHPKKEIICLVAASTPLRNITNSVQALQDALPNVNARKIAVHQPWLLREAPEAIKGRVQRCREMLLGVRNFSELVSYNPNLLDTSALALNIRDVMKRAPGYPPAKWIEMNLPPSKSAVQSDLLAAVNIANVNPSFEMPPSMMNRKTILKTVEREVANLGWKGLGNFGDWTSDNVIDDLFRDTDPGSKNP